MSAPCRQSPPDYRILTGSGGHELIRSSFCPLMVLHHPEAMTTWHPDVGNQISPRSDDKDEAPPSLLQVINIRWNRVAPVLLQSYRQAVSDRIEPHDEVLFSSSSCTHRACSGRSSFPMLDSHCPAPGPSRATWIKPISSCSPHCKTFLPEEKCFY